MQSGTPYNNKCEGGSVAADEERKSMNKLSKGIVLISAAALTLGLAACGSSTNSDAGHVYFLNNKPEVVDQWNELADMYTKETGVQVDIQSATSGSYESTLSSELAKNNAPTMFGIGGFDQYAKYKNYLEPLQDSEAYKLLNEQGKQMAHKDGDDVYGLPYAAEWFGIIANKKIINEYARRATRSSSPSMTSRISPRSRRSPTASSSTRTTSASTALSPPPASTPPTTTVTRRT